jgi:hypothetical protein
VIRELTLGVVRRVAAALLVLSLSGAMGLVPRAEADEHHCQCSLMGKRGQHQCACPLCRVAALRAAANDPSAPPCHRAAAQQALEEELARPENGGGPCLSSDCDRPRSYLSANASTEPFVLPAATVLRYVPTVERRTEPRRAPPGHASLPELPPPRAHLP